jgi:hypothetical protein
MPETTVSTTHVAMTLSAVRKRYKAPPAGYSANGWRAQSAFWGNLRGTIYICERILITRIILHRPRGGPVATTLLLRGCHHWAGNLTSRKTWLDLGYICGWLRLVFVTVWALPRSTLIRVGIAHVRSSIYVAHPTSDSQFSAVFPLFLYRYSFNCFLLCKLMCTKYV